MTEIQHDLDTFLLSDSNRKKFTTFLKTVSTHHSIDNLLTLYLLICCFKTHNSNTSDPSKLKQVINSTYKTCILKHETEIESILGSQLFNQLSECLKSGLYDERLLDQVKRSIRKILQNDYLPMYLKPDKVSKKTRASSSSLTPVSSGLGSKSGSSLSLNQIPNPYQVVTNPIKPKRNLETQSMFESRKSSKKSTNTSIRKSKPKAVEKDPKDFFNTLSSKLERISLNSDNVDDQLDAHLNHVSRNKISKSSRVNRTVVANDSKQLDETITNGVKRTVAYYMPGESLAYLSTFNGDVITLAQFKNLITKRGEFRYFFKTTTDLLGEECVVFQEETDDNAALPMFNDKIIAKIEY